MKDVSIVILAWNNVSDLRQCIESVVRGTFISYQLIVVDNDSTDGTREYLNQLQQDWNSENELTVVLNPTNGGYAAGNNTALPYLKGKYSLFLNQDIVVEEFSVDRLVEWIEDHTDYGVIAPQLRYPDGQIQPSCRVLPTPSKMIRNYLKGSWNDEATFDHSKSQDCEQPMASAILFPTDFIQEIGGFDDHPDFWLFFNDVDLSKRVAEAGRKSYFLADSVMIHHHGASTKKLFRIKKLQYWHRGMKRYFLKWYCHTWWQKIPLYVGVGISFVGLMVRDGIRSLKKR